VAKFESPLQKAKLSSWEDYAHTIASSAHSENLFKLLEDWYVALRLLVQSWEEEEQLVLQWLAMKNAFDIPASGTISGLRELQRLANNPDNFFKLDRLRHHLIEKKDLKGESFRCIVFVQQRITSVVLADFINRELGVLNFRAGYVAARNSKITPSISVTRSAASDTIQKFRSNEINVIVATSVIEEVRQLSP